MDEEELARYIQEALLTDGVRGWSVFTVDPGETTGWAWACVGRSELGRLGMVEALSAAVRHVSGVQLSDRRFACGQIKGDYSIGRFFEAEHSMAEDLHIEMVLRTGMTNRVSGGAVPRLSALVYEDFTLRERTKDRNLLSPIRVTAHSQSVLFNRWQIHSSSLPEIVLQSSSDKSVIRDDQLERWGLWQRGKPHANDAIRHLCLYLRKLEADL